MTIRNSCRRMGRQAMGVVVTGLLLASGVAAASGPMVTLVPVNVPLGDPSRDYPQFATQLDLQQHGYIEEEFFFEGAANRYSTPSLATGASQSQGYLVRYHNSVHPLVSLYDGYLMYIGVGGKLRVDLEPKVIKVDTENDVLFLGELAARQPDSDRLRIYEVAGTSHVGYSDPNLRGELLVRDQLPIADTSACARPALSRIPTSHVVNAAFDHLVRWIEKDVEPPIAPRLEILASLPVVVARDGHGNALGGIQLSQHAVPTATNTGANAGAGFCFLFGSHEPFDGDTLRNLYPNHGKYVSSVNKIDNANLKAGYIIKADAQQNSRDAARSDIGKH